ncbi:hypothetical protein MFIFM68171_02085 [Madurella fahalii]|uniref:Heterokaryon incompatibility domain-containing protein n=1 Tax=Madurella fahalii TaxID=1157608 RepID=A0ABQ0G2B8_9PEZI
MVFGEYRREGWDRYLPSFYFVSDVASANPGHLPDTFVKKHPNPRARTDPQACVRSLEYWMDKCAQHHDMCTPAPEPPLPTRVLRITDRGPTQPPKGSLMVSNGMCGNTPAECDRGPWSTLPQTFQDAAVFTRLLGKEFLRIDSICIVQDDEDDWRREAASMSEVYGNGFLTLMATKARDGRDRLFNPEPTLLAVEIPAPSGISDAPGQLFFREMTGYHLGSITLAGDWTSTDSEIHPLLQRAWVFQERFLSPRVVHFTAAGIAYECVQRCSSDWSPTDSPAPSKLVRGFWESPKAPADRSAFSGLWHHIVGMYSELNLTYDRDRLPGLAGIARRFAASNVQPGRYLAGAWEHTFRSDLMWYRKGDSSSAYGRPPAMSEWIAPSWSWASVKGCVIFHAMTCDLSLKEYCIQQPGGAGNEFGSVSSLRVRVSTRSLSGVLKRAEPGHYDYLCKLDLGVGAGSIEFSVSYSSFQEDFLSDRGVVTCIRAIEDTSYPHQLENRCEGLLVLQLVDGSSDTFRRIGVLGLQRSSSSVIWERHFKTGADLARAFQQQEERIIALV